MKSRNLFVFVFAAALIFAACTPAPSPTPVPPTTGPTAAAAAPTSATAAATTAATAAPTAAATAAAGGGDIIVEPVKPTAEAVLPTPRGTPPADGGVIVSSDGTPVPEGTPSKPIKPPATLDDLKKQYPDLQQYIDSIKDKDWNGINFSDLYKRVVDIYNKNGTTGVATFLKDSGILEKLNIPLSYLDLLIAFGDKGDLAAVEKLARSRKLINENNEIVGYLVVKAKTDKDPASNELKALGVTVYEFDENANEIEIGIPLKILSQLQTPSKIIDYLGKIAHVTNVVGFRAPIPNTSNGLSLSTAQQFVTVGPKTIGADKWHAAGFTGKGVKIGILDMGFGGILSAAGKQLPPANQIKSLQPLAQLDRQAVKHGTGCAIVVHGAAPDAELYVAQFDGSSRSAWIKAVDWLLKSGVQVINYSVGSPIGPRDGTFGDALVVDAIVKESGVLWVNAAGNEAQDHAMFKYKDDGKGRHAFGSKNGAMPFMAGEPETTVAMNWNGSWKGKEASEYIFTVLDANGDEVASGAEPKRGKASDYPFQISSFEATPGKIYYLVVERTRGNTDNVIDIFVPNGLIAEWAQTAGQSITVPGDSKSAFTVGATGLTNDKLEEYSSQGPTNDNRLKPDVTAPTREIVAVYPKGFAGTSGAAPLAAGAAGLVLGRYPDMTVGELRAFLIKNVKDLGKAGDDPQFGAGRIALPPPDTVSNNDPGLGKQPPSNNQGSPTTSPASSTGKAEITSVETQYNVSLKGQKGLSVTVSFAIQNFKGQKGLLAVLFFDQNDQPVPSSDKEYTVGKGLGVSKPFTPRYDESAYDDVVIFIPNSALQNLPKGMNELYYLVGVLDETDTSKPLAVSDKVTIRIRR